MDLRLDRVLTSPGIVKNAKTYTLLVEDGWLYIQPLGPGRAQTMPRADPFSAWLARKMLAKMLASADRKIEANEATLAASGPAAFPNGIRHELASVTAVSAEGDCLHLTVGETAWTFYGTGVLDDRDRSAELANFARALKNSP